MDGAADTSPEAPAGGRAGIAGPTPSVAGSAGHTEVVVGDGVPQFVAARGGRLYVWTETHACCTGGLTLLETAVAPPQRRSFRSAPLPADGFEVWFDAGRRAPPRTLTLELGRRGRRVRAFWNDCAYVD